MAIKTRFVLKNKLKPFTYLHKLKQFTQAHIYTIKYSIYLFFLNALFPSLNKISHCANYIKQQKIIINKRISGHFLQYFVMISVIQNHFENKFCVEVLYKMILKAKIHFEEKVTKCEVFHLAIVQDKYTMTRGCKLFCKTVKLPAH